MAIAAAAAAAVIGEVAEDGSRQSGIPATVVVIGDRGAVATIATIEVAAVAAVAEVAAGAAPRTRAGAVKAADSGSVLTPEGRHARRGVRSER